MQKNIARFKLPFTQGSQDGGFNANVMYDAEGSSVATLYGIPQSMTLEELGKAVARGEFNNAWDEGAARAAFIVKSCNLHDELVAALAFYASKQKWDEFRSDQLDAAFDRNTGSALGDDGGKTARAILAKLEAK